MAKSYFQCAECGASVAVVGRNRSDADRLSKYRSESGALCHGCWTKQRDAERAEASQKAAEEAAQSGLPVLRGTEKQIFWAETIRAQMLKQIEEGIGGKSDIYYWDDRHIFELLTDDRQEYIRTHARELPGAERAAFRAKIRGDLLDSDRMQRALDAIRSNDSAHWWIENRELKVSRLLVEQYRNTAPESEPALPAGVVADAKSEATVRPLEPKTETVAELLIAGREIHVTFEEKREDFRELVKKQLGMTWGDGYWKRLIGSMAGDIEDRLVDAGHRLLGAGFIIRIYDAALRARAVSGEFEAEHTRWVTRRTQGAKAGWFCILWGRDEDYYAPARKLPRSQYDKPYVIVPPEHFEEVLDFSERYDFHLTASGQELAEQARVNRDAALVTKVEPKPKSAGKKIKQADKPEPMQTPDSQDVDDALRDE